MNLVNEIKKLSRMKKIILLITIFIVLFWMIYIFILDNKLTNKKGTIVVHSSVKPKSLDFCNAVETNSVYNENFLSFIHDTLLQEPKDSNSEAQKNLVDKWELLENDPKKIRVTLKKDIFFHNDRKVTTDDIIFTFDRAKKNCNNNFDNISKIILINDEEFEIELKQNLAWKDFVFYKYFRIFNKKAFEESEEKGLKIGTGPYKLVKYDIKRDIYELEKFDKYHNEDIINNLPKTIDIKIVKNYDTALQELQTNKIDIILQYPSNKINDIKKDNKNFDIKEFEIPSVTYMYFNKKNTKKKVREAISKAIDIKDIIKSLEFLNTPAYGGCLHPCLIGFNESIKNLERVNKEEAKLITNNLNSQEKKIKLLKLKEDDPILTKISSCLQEIGLEPSIEQLEFNEGTKRFVHEDSQYNIMFLGENHELPWGYKFFEDYFAPSINTEYNFCHIDDSDKPYIEDKLIRAKNSSLNKEEFEKLIQEIQEYLYNEIYIIPLTYNKQYSLISKKISDIKITQFGRFDFNNFRVKR